MRVDEGRLAFGVWFLASLSFHYEITDHLGIVRALVRDNINTYTATMEDNDQEEISNPRVEEMQYFENLSKPNMNISR